MQTSVAAAVVIGNEVLNAQVADENGSHLIQRLRERGIALRSLCVVPDEVEAIIDAVVRARRRAQWVFTSGGIGPTHDDVTVRRWPLRSGGGWSGCRKCLPCWRRITRTSTLRKPCV